MAPKADRKAAKEKKKTARKAAKLGREQKRADTKAAKKAKAAEKKKAKAGKRGGLFGLGRKRKEKDEPKKPLPEKRPKRSPSIGSDRTVLVPDPAHIERLREHSEQYETQVKQGNRNVAEMQRERELLLLQYAEHVRQLELHEVRIRRAKTMEISSATLAEVEDDDDDELLQALAAQIAELERDVDLMASAKAEAQVEHEAQTLQNRCVW